MEISSVSKLDILQEHVEESLKVKAEPSPLIWPVWTTYIMDWIMFTPNSYVEALISDVTVFEDMDFKEVIKVKIEWGTNSVWLASFKKRKRHQGCAHTEKGPCEDIAKRWPSASQGEKPRKKPTLLAPWSWTFSLQNYEKINFCCLSHPVCGILLWQP